MPRTRNAADKRRKMHPMFAVLYLAAEAEDESQDDRRPRRRTRLAIARAGGRPGQHP